jgi:hypothetical protein
MKALRLGTLLIVIAACFAAIPAAAASSETTGACNEQTATELGGEYDLNPFAPIVTTMSPLCGEFLGSGVESMIARAIPATCGGYAGWGAFRREADGSWQLVQKERNGQIDLKASGNDLEETLKILGFREPRCGKVKSTRTRTWHWNGQQLATGTWSVHPYGLAPTLNVSAGHFGVICTIADSPKVPSLPGHRYHNGVACLNFTRHSVPQKADLWPGGKVKTCRTQKGCGGNVQCGCAVDVVEVHPGEQIVKGRFTCLVTQTSVTCTVATGQGFTVTANTVKRLPKRLGTSCAGRLTASSRTSKERCLIAPSRS